MPNKPNKASQWNQQTVALLWFSSPAGGVRTINKFRGNAKWLDAQHQERDIAQRAVEPHAQRAAATEAIDHIHRNHTHHMAAVALALVGEVGVAEAVQAAPQSLAGLVLAPQSCTRLLR